MEILGVKAGAIARVTVCGLYGPGTLNSFQRFLALS